MKQFIWSLVDRVPLLPPEVSITLSILSIFISILAMTR